jgi:hypothetical protein
MFMTSKGNFVVEWRPVGTVHDKPGPGCDWKHWYRIGAYFDRPSNELIFIRSLRDVARAFGSAYETDAELKRRVAERPEWLKSPGLLERLKQSRDKYCAQRLATDATLLQAAADLADLLKRRLRLCFDVRLVDDIYTEWQEIEDSSEPLGTMRILMKWSIDNAAERTRQSEISELSTLAAETGCSAEALATVLKELVPNAHSPERRLTNELKKAG